MSSGYLALDVALGSLGVYLLTSLLTKSNHPPLPPGPKRKPIIGNLTDLPPAGELEWVHWAKHKDLYGPISSVTVFGQSIIVVNDLQLTYELLDKRSSVFSDRPIFPFIGSMCGWDATLVISRYGERLKSLRRYLHRFMGNSSSMVKHYPVEELETRQFLLSLLEHPDKIQDQIRGMAGSLILKMSHGYTTDKRGPDPMVALADEVMTEFSLGVQAGAWMVDLMPFLKNLPDWMPGTGFKRIAAKWKNDLQKIVDLPHGFVKQQMATGSNFPSFTSGFLEDGVKSEEDETLIKWAAFAIYGGGADTTVSALYSFFLAMTLFPDVQKTAQAELDRVVGDRLPSFGDRAHLPYIEALVKETLRWNPVTPLGVPHTASEDSTFNGYFIPKGSIVLPNIWWFTHDPNAFKNPFEFKPERFLGDKPENDPHNIAFGFGRRICPGKELADSSIFISIAMILSVFNVSKAKDSNGNFLEAVPDYTTGVISHPKEFPCSLTPRSERAVQLIQSVQDEVPAGVSDAEVLAHVKL